MEGRTDRQADREEEELRNKGKKNSFAHLCVYSLIRMDFVPVVCRVLCRSLEAGGVPVTRRFGAEVGLARPLLVGSFGTKFSVRELQVSRPSGGYLGCLPGEVAVTCAGQWLARGRCEGHGLAVQRAFSVPESLPEFDS